MEYKLYKVKDFGLITACIDFILVTSQSFPHPNLTPCQVICSLYQERLIIFLCPIAVGLSHKTCFDQWNLGRRGCVADPTHIVKRNL